MNIRNLPTAMSAKTAMSALVALAALSMPATQRASAQSASAQSASAQSASAQSASAPTLRVGGQIRPRIEARDDERSAADATTTMRTRLDLSSELSPMVSARVQFQDVRTFGAEPSTTTSAAQVDLHQAYVDLGNLHTPFFGRVGRQEISLGEERLVGAADWIQNARALDGVKVRTAVGALAAQGFLFQVGDRSAAGRTQDDYFSGIYATASIRPKLALDTYVLRNDAPGSVATHQNTLGARLAGASGRLTYHGEAAAQRGTRRGADVRSYIATVRAGVDIGAGFGVTLQYDHLSGDADSTDNVTRVFDTLYGTNHKYYGIADVFTNIPQHTRGYGLRDAAAKLSWKATPKVTTSLDIHDFTTAAATAAGSGLGREIDLFGSYQYSPWLAVSGGAARFDAGTAFAETGRPRVDQFFSYLMMTVVL